MNLILFGHQQANHGNQARINFSSTQRAAFMNPDKTEVSTTNTPQGNGIMPNADLQKVYFGSNVTKPVRESMSLEELDATEALATEYKDFISKAVCGPWAAKLIIEAAEQRGFTEMPEDLSSVQAGDKYYVNNDFESVGLVVIGKDDPTTSGFNIVGAHMDSPQLELKPNTLTESQGFAKLKTKPHGGGTWMTWFNRPLKIAGRIFRNKLDNDGNPLLDPNTKLPIQTSEFVRMDDFQFTIPIEPPHFNNTINEGRKINKETDLNPVAGITKGIESELDDSISAHVARVLKEEYNFDITTEADRAQLYLFPSTPPSDIGVDGNIILGQGHDDRSMCYAAMEAIFDAVEKNPTPDKTSLALFFNDEEVGSENYGGAESNWTTDIATDIVAAHPESKDKNQTQAVRKALSNSFILSADVVHAREPQQAQYHDHDNAIDLGHGPALKADTQGRYATTTQGMAVAKDLAKRAGVQVQVYGTKQDVPCGSTIGPSIASQTNALTVDMGAPVLSMHASEELMTKEDLYLCKKLFSSFFRNE